MKLADYLRLGWDQLKRRVVVTALCAMGIAIGSSSIIVALSFGESINQFSRDRLNQFLKSDEIIVQSETSGDPQQNAIYKLTKAKIDIMRTLPHIKALATYRTIQSVNFETDGKEGYINQVVATELDTLDDFGIELQQGSPGGLENTIILSYGATMGLSDERLSRMQSGGNKQQNSEEAERNWRERMRTAYPLYQKTILLKLRSQSYPTKETVETFPVRVIGILKKPDGLSDDMISNQKTAYISPELGLKLAEAQDRLNNGGSQKQNGVSKRNLQPYDQVKLKITDIAHVKEAETLLKKLKLNVQTNLHQEERMKSEMLILRIVFGGAGVFILFVASISIVVAMTMSTYQRRRQIGIMKVLGSNLAQIRNMFMIESALLGLLGGIVGILLSYWVIWGINIIIMRFTPGGGSQMNEILFISPWILPVGLFFAIMTGVLSGIYPAIKASRTDALTAIKRD